MSTNLDRSELLLTRLTAFATESRKLVIKLPRTAFNRIYGNQLIRASSSPGANYIEALEALSSKDFVHRLKICRKELRESSYWLNLISTSNENFSIINIALKLQNESDQLTKIFSASINTITNKMKNDKC